MRSLSKRDQGEIGRSAEESPCALVSPADGERYIGPASDTPYPFEYAFHLLGNVREKLLLDLSCGTDQDLIPLAWCGACAIGMDTSPELVQGRSLAGFTRIAPSAIASTAKTYEDVPKNGQRGRGRGRNVVRYFMWTTILLMIAAAVVLLRWSGYLLISDEALPSHVDAAVVLQGSILGEKARIAGAVLLLQHGITDRILVSVPKESYWGQRIAPIAYAYNERLYGAAIASRFVFCETNDDVDSTEDESKVLFDCIQAHGWHSITIVTSDYHTRRAGIIWRRILRDKHSSVQLWVHAVPDPEFHASAWWRDRRSAKYWFLECTKLLWTL